MKKKTKRKIKRILIAVAILFGIVIVTKPWILKEAMIYVEYLMRGGNGGGGVSSRNVDGIDVSHHNGWINWGKVAENPNIQFVYVKATQGYGYRDPLFSRNLREARNAGLNVGVYHFFTSKKSGAQQFSHFKSTVGRNIGNIIPMVDVEYGGGIDGMSATEVQRELTSFCELIKAEYGRKPIIYTSGGIYNKMLGGKFDSYYIWISRYGRRPNLKGNGKYNIWQFSRKGTISGIEGNVDLNRLENGMTVDKLKL